nr:PREDICTED: location of vulva defective 1-like [Latimeria chalumnae]|eukprot:XP_014353074.1 PREDICTED: location of vulva defective 1-like [Latimeria chalumnae]
MRFTNLEFTASLNDKASNESQSTRNNITEVLTQVLSKNTTFVEIIINKFSNGSVLADATATYQRGSTTEEKVRQTIVNSATTLESNGLQLDVNALLSITTTASPTAATTTKPATTTTKPSTTTITTPLDLNLPFPGFAVAIIVMCILAILAVSILIVVYYV